MQPMPPGPPGPPGPPNGPPSGSGPSWPGTPPGPPGPPTGPGSPYGGGPEAPKSGRPAWLLPVGLGAVVGALVGVGIWLLVAGGGDDDQEVGGTGGGTVTTQEPDATTSTSETTGTTEPSGGAEISLTGTWEGTYVCTQGETGMTLTIVDTAGDLDAIVEWYEVDSNPGVPSGAYAMEGTIDGTELELSGTEWIDQPEDYVMADITAELDTSGATPRLEGTVVGERCSDLSLEQTATTPWYEGTWTGGYDCGQGLTGLTLTIDDVGDNKVEAVFEFYEVPENPGVPSGSYRLEGAYDDHGLVMEGVEWIERPAGYLMVGLESDFITRPDYFAGVVTDRSCTAFLLERQT